MPLPFGLKLKRTRRYTVSSKNCLVARIQLLSDEFLEYTLSVESTAQECLEAVAQRLELREVTYFSLWYFNKQNQQRWVDLEKPLKKQLDKYGVEPTVYFGVVFYVPDVFQLQQEITRYQYYLQLKKDVLEGRIPCSIEQAIRLASLALQADFGDFDHFDSQGFLQKLVLFPVGWIQDERVLEEATQKVVSLYQKYRGLLSAEAEMLYMQEVEKMEGYGEECYQAKDSQGTDVIIGTCLDGIFVKYKNGRPPVIFRWNDINNMTHNRSFFALELSNKEETIQFQTEDLETSKYVCRMCLPNPQPCLIPTPQMHYNGQYNEFYKSSQDNLYLTSQNGFFYHSQTSLDHSTHEYNGQIHNGSLYSAHSTSSLNNPQHHLQTSPMSSNPSITGSDMRADYVTPHRHSTLIPPSYRATPDYETVMRQKKQSVLHNDHQKLSARDFNISTSYAYGRPDLLVYSQPEIREHSHLGAQGSSQFNAHLNYSFHSPSPYLYAREHRHVVGAVSVPELTNVQAQEYCTPNILRTQVYRPPPPYPYPRPANSTPDLSHHFSVSNSNPDLVTRRVHHSVQTFQEDSLPVAHSLQEVSEPLIITRSRHMNKRNSIEIAGLAYGIEGIKVKERNMSLSGAETNPPHIRSSGSKLHVFLEKTKSQDGGSNEDVQYCHNKTLSDATMLVHSSGEEEDFDESACHVPQDTAGTLQQHVAVPREPVDRPISYLCDQPLTPQDHGMSHESHGLIQESELGHSSVESDIFKATNKCLQAADTQRSNGSTQVSSIMPQDLRAQPQQRPKQNVDGKWPVPDVLTRRKNPLDSFQPLLGMKRGTKSEVKKMGPLKLAALNGLAMSKMPVHSENKKEPENISNDERCKILEQQLEKGMVFTEYEQLPKKFLDAECSVAQLPENSERNRFQDVLPYDNTRVELVPTKENNTGYINASHIKVIVSGHEWNYIATQGPLSNTCQDFWQMVWEQGVVIIAMVTAEEEAGREKSFGYWPRLGSRHNTVTYGRFKITTRFRTDSGCYATTGLKVKHLLSGQERTVWHLQYTDWPDHGCPEDFKGFLSYLEEIQSVRRHTNSTTDPKNPIPVLIHCSAGVGRTGVVILSEIMIACLEHNEMVDVPTVLSLLRHQRMMMVQTISQYIFVYKVLIQFLKNSRLI
uniref:Tyrosine-protein phosphatase non-receptor type n=1 Tax=Scleropages formosus TaxID=113540 RepID=A0A8C9TYN1_SCLFO